MNTFTARYPQSEQTRRQGFNLLPRQRILSIDTLRGITILVMIFVNEVAGVREIPAWMKHMPADADAMTFVDMVFPAFLFIVGMSVPFAYHNRLSKGDGFWKLQGHILFRTLGLLLLGVFMVNAEGGYNQAAMGMSIHLWSLCFFLAAILVWNVYSFQNPVWAYLLRGVGLVALLVLGLIYRGGDGTERMQPQWWGILGLIGWAYLYTCVLYQLFRGRIAGLLLMVAVCTGIYALGHSDYVHTSPLLSWTAPQAGHAAHTSIVLCGVILSLIFFDQRNDRPVYRRMGEALAFALLLFVAGAVLRPAFGISKIYATPTWCLYSAAACCLLFAGLYWLIDLRKVSRWTVFFQPAASNPLLIYIIPYILAALFGLFSFYPQPAFFNACWPGVLWCLVYAVLLMWLVRGLNQLRIRLQL
jgi:heparan-alpha-glucosaminide N-acetyltransferase